MPEKSKTYEKKSPRVYIRTFGCQMNSRDSEIIYGLLFERGWGKAGSIEEADCVLFNTCSVRHHAEQRAYSNMGSLARRKRRNPKLILGFIGCTAQKDKDLVFKRLPHVDLVAGPGNIYNIPDYLDAIMRGEKMVLAADSFERPQRKNPSYREGRASAYISISEGCDNFCSYCIVPYVRGRQRSRKREPVINEVRSTVEMGIKEITLLGQNVNSYGKDLKNGSNFVNLLEEINSIDGIKRIRFVSCHPKDTTEELFKAMRGLSRVYNHLHLPLQSGSDKILKAMKRGYTPGHYMSLIDMLRSYIPDCNITTDIIIGFPGETEKDFKDTYDVMRKIKFDSAYIFKYSPRPPAVSSKLPDDVPEEVKKKRHAELLELQKEISRDKKSSRKSEILPMA
ncbi:MAG: tRNA (N6-isopentenyl adenosine(37)-C2)-methylthiotransferase MiaB [Candidatus Omnitrophota bacterium]|nr:tRNA (N6-isopentenyl adenosine(37)-C2)-methylthiotransferase MiaB [Candidatus Omnitrophota bacterium]